MKKKSNRNYHPPWRNKLVKTTWYKLAVKNESKSIVGFRDVYYYIPADQQKQLFFLTTKKKLSSLFLPKNFKKFNSQNFDRFSPSFLAPVWDKYYQFSHLFLYRRMTFRLKFNFFNIFSFCDVFFAKKNMNFWGNDLWQKPFKKGKKKWDKKLVTLFHRAYRYLVI